MYIYNFLSTFMKLSYNGDAAIIENIQLRQAFTDFILRE